MDFARTHLRNSSFGKTYLLQSVIYVKRYEFKTFGAFKYQSIHSNVENMAFVTSLRSINLAIMMNMESALFSFAGTIS